MHIDRKTRLAGLFLASVAGANAVAQDNAAIEEVIVSATKIGTAIEDTPIAVTVVSGEELSAKGIISVNDLPNVAPGLEVGYTNFGPVLNIRGVSTTDNTSKGGQGIGFIVDGISVGRPIERATALFDIDRIEVLRGPQGTLYGKSTTGGVISVVTRRPGEEFGGNIDIEYGNFNTVRANAGVDLPVADRVKLRLALNSNQSDGWLEPVLGDPSFRLLPLNDEDRTAARLSATIDFSDSTSLFLTTTRGQSGGRGDGGIPWGVFQTESGAAQRQAFGNFINPYRDEDFSNFTAELTHSFGALDLTYVGGIREHKSFGVQIFPEDYTLTGEHDWSNYNQDADTTSHEIRLSGDSDRFVWLAGYHWIEERVWESYHQWGLPIQPGVPLEMANSTNDLHPLNRNWHKSDGIFGQVNIRLTDSLGLTLGYRKSDDSIKRLGTFALGTGGGGPNGEPNAWLDPNGVPCRAPNFCIGVPNNAYQGASKDAWRVGVDYDLSGGDGMVFATVATGYKQGGFNDFGPLGPAAGAVSYEPEEMTAWEFGYKGNPTDSLTYRASLFYYDYSKMQISDVREVAFGTFVLFTLTAPTEVKGIENELSWRISDQSQLDVELQLYDSQYVDFDAGARGDTPFGPGVPFTPWDGFPLDRVPDVSGAVGYTHYWQLAGGASLTGNIRMKYSSGYVMASIQNAYQHKQGSFTRTDLNLTYLTGDERFNIGLFVRNLEDDLQLVSGLGAVPPTGDANRYTVSVNKPRTAGITFGFSF